VSPMRGRWVSPLGSPGPLKAAGALGEANRARVNYFFGNTRWIDLFFGHELSRILRVQAARGIFNHLGSPLAFGNINSTATNGCADVRKILQEGHPGQHLPHDSVITVGIGTPFYREFSDMSKMTTAGDST
jgi:hypothetical protein